MIFESYNRFIHIQCSYFKSQHFLYPLLRLAQVTNPGRDITVHGLSLYYLIFKRQRAISIRPLSCPVSKSHTIGSMPQFLYHPNPTPLYVEIIHAQFNTGMTFNIKCQCLFNNRSLFKSRLVYCIVLTYIVRT